MCNEAGHDWKDTKLRLMELARLKEWENEKVYVPGPFVQVCSQCGLVRVPVPKEAT